MIRVNLFFDYITSLLEKQPLEFDNKKCMYIKLLDDLKSLEKNHKSVLALQKWISEAHMAEKHLGADIKKSDNILIYCKQSQSIESMELMTLQKKKTIIESKKKLFNALNTIDLNQRLLQKKNQREIEQAQFKFNDVYHALESLTDVYNQLHTQNNTSTTKINEIFALMRFAENQLEHQITDLKLNVQELNTSIMDISKETLLEYNNEKKDRISQKSNKEVVKFESSLSNAFTEFGDIIDSFNRTEMLKPLKTLSINDRLLNVNWTDFLTMYNFTRQKFTQNFLQNCKTVTAINTFVINLDNLEKKFNASLRNIVDRINNAKNEREIYTNILKDLNHELYELKKENNILMNSIDKNDKLEVGNIGELENKLRESNDRLIATVKNKEKLLDDLQHLNFLMNTTFQKYTNRMDYNQQELLQDDKPPSKVLFLYEKLRAVKNDYEEIRNKRKEIIMDQFNRKKFATEAITREKSQIFENTRNKILLYEDKIKINEQFLVYLKDFDTSLENAKNDALQNYHDLVFQNHGKSLEQLKDEEIEFTNSINVYNEELVELNKEYKNIENHPKLIILQDMEAQMENLKETLKKVTRANANLEMELNKKNRNAI